MHSATCALCHVQPPFQHVLLPTLPLKRPRPTPTAPHPHLLQHSIFLIAEAIVVCIYGAVHLGTRAPHLQRRGEAKGGQQ